jgi:hypothetical protein
LSHIVRNDLRAQSRVVGAILGPTRQRGSTLSQGAIASESSAKQFAESQWASSSSLHRFCFIRGPINCSHGFSSGMPAANWQVMPDPRLLDGVPWLFLPLRPQPIMASSFSQMFSGAGNCGSAAPLALQSVVQILKKMRIYFSAHESVLHKLMMDPHVR